MHSHLRSRGAVVLEVALLVAFIGTIVTLSQLKSEVAQERARAQYAAAEAGASGGTGKEGKASGEQRQCVNGEAYRAEADASAAAAPGATPKFKAGFVMTRQPKPVEQGKAAEACDLTFCGTDGKCFTVKVPPGGDLDKELDSKSGLPGATARWGTAVRNFDEAAKSGDAERMAAARRELAVGSAEYRNAVRDAFGAGSDEFGAALKGTYALEDNAGQIMSAAQGESVGGAGTEDFSKVAAAQRVASADLMKRVLGNPTTFSTLADANKTAPGFGDLSEHPDDHGAGRTQPKQETSDWGKSGITPQKGQTFPDMVVDKEVGKEVRNWGAIEETGDSRAAKQAQERYEAALAYKANCSVWGNLWYSGCQTRAVLDARDARNEAYYRAGLTVPNEDETGGRTRADNSVTDDPFADDAFGQVGNFNEAQRAKLRNLQDEYDSAKAREAALRRCAGGGLCAAGDAKKTPEQFDAEIKTAKGRQQELLNEGAYMQREAEVVRGQKETGQIITQEEKGLQERRAALDREREEFEGPAEGRNCWGTWWCSERYNTTEKYEQRKGELDAKERELAQAEREFAEKKKALPAATVKTAAEGAPAKTNTAPVATTEVSAGRADAATGVMSQQRSKELALEAALEELDKAPRGSREEEVAFVKVEALEKELGYYNTATPDTADGKYFDAFGNEYNSSAERYRAERRGELEIALDRLDKAQRGSKEEADVLKEVERLEKILGYEPDKNGSADDAKKREAARADAARRAAADAAARARAAADRGPGGNGGLGGANGAGAGQGQQTPLNNLLSGLQKAMGGQQKQGGAKGGGGSGGQQNPNTAACTQWPGTTLQNGQCTCPTGQSWNGSACAQQNQCAQYPGTTLVNNQCTCPQGQNWTGAKCEDVGGTATSTLKAQLACSPQAQEPGEKIALSYSCVNANTIRADGFTITGNRMSGELEVVATTTDATDGRMKFALTCAKEGKIEEARCEVAVSKAFIVLVATPSTVESGKPTKIGWITGGMKASDDACSLKRKGTSDVLKQGRSSVYETPGITGETMYVLSCTTAAGFSKTAEVTVKVK